MKQEDMLKEMLKQLAFVTGKLESIDNQDNQEKTILCLYKRSYFVKWFTK